MLLSTRLPELADMGAHYADELLPKEATNLLWAKLYAHMARSEVIRELAQAEWGSGVRLGHVAGKDAQARRITTAAT